MPSQLKVRQQYPVQQHNKIITRNNTTRNQVAQKYTMISLSYRFKWEVLLKYIIPKNPKPIESQEHTQKNEKQKTITVFPKHQQTVQEDARSNKIHRCMN